MNFAVHKFPAYPNLLQLFSCLLFILFIKKDVSNEYFEPVAHP